MDVGQTDLSESMKCLEARHVNPPMHKKGVKVSKKATQTGGGGNHRKPRKARMISAEEKKQRAEFRRCAEKTMRSFGVSYLCATFIIVINKKLLNGDYKIKEEYEDAVHKIEDFCKVKLLDRMPEYETSQMNIDHTNLLKAHKREEPKEPTDAEKIEAANELHDWQTKKEQEK